jgi:guanine deaminase
MTAANEQFMQAAIDLSLANVESGQGRPFGAVVVKDGKIIGRGTNIVTVSHDPTAHAEVLAIRAACQALQQFQLTGCDLYTSCEPCPMCLGAIYWAKLDRVYYANTKADATAIGFDSQLVYAELALPLTDRQLPMIPLMRDQAAIAFQAWVNQSSH